MRCGLRIEHCGSEWFQSALTATISTTTIGVGEIRFEGSRWGGRRTDDCTSPGFSAADAGFFGPNVLGACNLPQERYTFLEPALKKEIPDDAINNPDHGGQRSWPNSLSFTRRGSRRSLRTTGRLGFLEHDSTSATSAS